MSDDLIAKIRSAIDEDERLAKVAIEVLEGQGWTWQGLADGLWKQDVYGADPLWDYLERQDPARVLRQVAANRKMLDLHDQSEAHGDFTYCRACGTTARPCETLRALAEAYGIETEGNRS